MMMQTQALILTYNAEHGMALPFLNTANHILSRTWLPAKLSKPLGNKSIHKTNKNMFSLIVQG